MSLLAAKSDGSVLTFLMCVCVEKSQICGQRRVFYSKGEHIFANTHHGSSCLRKSLRKKPIDCLFFGVFFFNNLMILLVL